MQKTTFTLSLFVILTLSLTSLGIADFTVINNSNKNAWMASQKWRKKTANYPEGHRTTGWYKISPGQSQLFREPDPDEDGASNYVWVYIEFFGGPEIRPVDHENRDSRLSWIRPKKKFTIVESAEGDFLKGDVPKNQLVQKDLYRYKYSESLTLRVLANGTLEPSDLFEPEEEVAAEVTPVDGIAISITPNPTGTTLNQGTTRELILSVRKNGSPLSNKQVFLLLSKEVAKLTPNNGKTNQSGKFKTTLKVNNTSSDGTFKVTAQVAGTSAQGSLTFRIKAAAGQINVSASPSTVEPGKSTTVTITARTPTGNLFPGAEISLEASLGNIKPSLVTTKTAGSKLGTVTATWTADSYSGTPHPNQIASCTITATLIKDKKVRGTTKIPVKYTPGSFSVSVPRTITSGNKATVTATVKSSKSGALMKGVPVYFSEKSTYLRFSSSSATTNSSGKASVTLRTGGESSGTQITVRPSGLSSKSYTVRIKPFTETDTKSFHIISESAPCKRRIFGVCVSWSTDLYEWSKTVSFPGRVLDHSVSGGLDTNDVLLGGEGEITGSRRSGNTVTVRGVIERHVNIPNDIRGEVWAKYEAVAYSPGAPSLQQPQLHPKIDQLSMFWKDMSQVPSETVLLPNYPNPFNPETWIPYHLAEAAYVTITIYATEGRLVRKLALGHQPAGIYESKSRAAYWDGRNNVGERVASGIYFYTLAAGDFAATKKMLILK